MFAVGWCKHEGCRLGDVGRGFGAVGLGLRHIMQ